MNAVLRGKTEINVSLVHSTTRNSHLGGKKHEKNMPQRPRHMLTAANTFLLEKQAGELQTFRQLWWEAGRHNRILPWRGLPSNLSRRRWMRASHSRKGSDPKFIIRTPVNAGSFCISLCRPPPPSGFLNTLIHDRKGFARATNMELNGFITYTVTTADNRAECQQTAEVKEEEEKHSLENKNWAFSGVTLGFDPLPPHMG